MQVTSNLPDHEILTVSLIIQTERLSVFLVNLQLPSGQERVVFLCQRRSKETENGEKVVWLPSLLLQVADRRVQTEVLRRRAGKLPVWPLAQ